MHTSSSAYVVYSYLCYDIWDRVVFMYSFGAMQRLDIAVVHSYEFWNNICMIIR